MTEAWSLGSRRKSRMFPKRSPCTFSSFTFLLASVALLSTMLGQSAAQDSNTTIIDLTDPTMIYEREFVISQVPVLRFLVPSDTECLETDRTNCSDTTEGNCFCETFLGDRSSPVMCRFDRGSNIVHITVTVDERYKAGCGRLLTSVNATSPETGVSLDPVTLMCDPVSTVGQNLSEANVVWRRFMTMDQMQQFINNCSSDCSSVGCMTSPANTVSGNGFTLARNNLTIMSPASNHAWFVPTFVFNNCTHVAPGTYLYRWPKITSNYEFSLEVQEQTTDYSGLRCEVDSFPPLTTIRWSREGASSSVENEPRYNFTNITSGNGQVTVNGIVTIDRVTFQDSSLFTCEVDYDASSPNVENTKLSVRLRVKGRLRPLWPAVGLIGVGIVVSLFIIIGHFIDKEIEKHQNEPSNPSHHKRLQSITSTMENDNSTNNTSSTKKEDHSKLPFGSHSSHSPVKRLSSARLQLLEEPQC